jgi:hypothetical protein
MKAAVGAMALGFFALAARPADAVTVITINDTISSISCSGTNSCAGFTQSGSPGAPSGLGTLGTTADLFHLANSSPTTETAALNTLAGTSFLATDETKVDSPATSFIVNALYFMIKIGGGTLPGHEDHAFFKLLVPGEVQIVYDQNGQTSGGLSHIAVWGGTVTPIPLPAALPMLLTAIGGLFMLGRRRREIAA